MTSGIHVTVFRVLLSLFCLLVAPSVGAEVRLQPGDTLRVTVLGHETLSTEAAVDPSGNVFLPLIGPLQVGYLSLTRVREEVISSYSGAVYRDGDGIGGEIVRSVDPAGITVDVAQYRPIYIFGDVQSPGPAEYRPGLTVLQAVASVGGPGRLFEGSEGNELAVVRLSTRISTLKRRIELEREEIARLRQDLQDLLRGNVSADLVEGQDASGGLSSDQDGWNFARQRARLLRDQETQEAVLRLQNRLETLKAQEDNAMRSVDLYASRVEELEAAAQLRPIQTQTLLDARLALLLASSRALGIGAERGTAEVDLSRARLGDTLADQVEIARLIDVISGKEANLQLSTVELQGLNLESQFLGAPTPDLVAETRYKISREVSIDEWIEFSAGPQVRVEPGDVIEVSLSFREVAGGLSLEQGTDLAEQRN